MKTFDEWWDGGAGKPVSVGYDCAREAWKAGYEAGKGEVYFPPTPTGDQFVTHVDAMKLEKPLKIGAAPSQDYLKEATQALLDAVDTGTGVLKDGKRIDPKDIYAAQPQEPTVKVSSVLMIWRLMEWGAMTPNSEEGWIAALEPFHIKSAPSQEPVCWLREEWLHYEQSSDQDKYAFPVYTHPSDAAAQIAKKDERIASLISQYDLVTTELRGKIAKLESQLAAATRLIDAWAGDPPAKEWAEWEKLK